MDSGVVLLGLIVAGGGLWAARKMLATRAAEERQATRASAENEDLRLEGCEEVARFYLNHLGYLAREAMTRGELQTHIASGIAPGALSELLGERCARVPGVALGYRTVGGYEFPITLPDSFRERHSYLVGKSGMGKTTLIRNLILQDLEAGRGAAVIAPEAELLTDELLPFIPESRWDDVVYVNPQDSSCPVPFNPLHVDPGEDLDLKVSETLTIFRRVFDESSGGGPRLETILRQALYVLMQLPGSTLLDVEKLLDRQHGGFRESALAQIRDAEARQFWTSVYPSYPKDAHLPVVNRLGRFLRPKVVRNLLCSKGPSLNVRRAMDEGKILLFNLSDGILGETNAELLGQLVVAKLQMAAMSRADVPKERRRPFPVYIDEFQSFCGVAATSYEKILSRARKYGLWLTLAHQQTGQIPESLLKEILGNVSTMVVFAVGASDARRLSTEMVGEIDGVPTPLDAQELPTLRVGETFCKIGQNVFFMPTYPPPRGGSFAARAEIERRSQERYGVRIRPENAPPSPVNPLGDLDPGDVFAT